MPLKLNFKISRRFLKSRVKQKSSKNVKSNKFKGTPRFLSRVLSSKQASSVKEPILATSLVPALQPVLAHQVSEVSPPVPLKGISAEELIRPESRLRAAIESFLADQRSEHTRRAYRNDLKRFVKFLILRRQAITGLEVSRGTVVSFKEFLIADGLKPPSVDRHLASLRSFFGWLKEDGLIADNPAERVRFLAQRKVSPTRGFSDEEVVRVLLQPDLHSRSGALHYAVLVLLFYCGLRRSELCALRAGDVLSEKGMKILRVKGKGGSERLIPMVSRAWNGLQHYLRITQRAWAWDDLLKIQDQPLFCAPGGEGRALHPSLIFYIVRRYARAAGIDAKVSPHSCRATAISNARDHKVPDRAIQEFAGWTSPQMITQYDKRKTMIEESAAHAIRYGEQKEG